jgi:hypothetical protein
LHTVCHDFWKILCKLGADRDLVAAGLAAQQHNHFSNEFININQLRLQPAFLEQQADSANDVSRAGYVFNNSRGGFACLCHIGIVPTKPSQAGLSVCNCCGNRLPNLVRQRRSQLAHGGHPVYVREIRLCLTQSFALFTRELAFHGNAGEVRGHFEGTRLSRAWTARFAVIAVIHGK